MEVKLLSAPPWPTPQTAYFCDWSLVNRLCSAQLSGFLHRTVCIAISEGEHPNNWEVLFEETPLSKEELQALLNGLQANSCDWDANDFGEYPVWGLSQSVSEKLLIQAVPYPSNGIHASDDGVWLTTEAIVKNPKEAAT